MAIKTIQLTIPAPCQQRWQDMEAENTGRFCASCQKTVVDFSSLTDLELIERLARKNDSTCGRFRASQLNRKLTVSAPALQPPIRLFGLLTAGLLGYQTVQADTLPLLAEPAAQHLTLSLTTNVLPLTVEETTPTDSIRVIKGRVIEKGTTVAVPGATVVVKETSLGTNVDAEGCFQLHIPPDLANELITLRIAGIGYLSQEIQLHPEHIDSLMISLNEDSVALNQVLVVGNYKKPTFFQRLRNQLRSKH